MTNNHVEKVTRLDVTNTKSMQAAMRAVLDGVAQQYGVTIRIKRFAYEEFRADISLELRVAGSFGFAQEGEDFKRQAHLFQLPPEILGTEFPYEGKTYCFVGLSRTRRRFPFITLEIASRRTMYCTEDFLKERLSERIAAIAASKTAASGGLGLEL